MTNGKHQIATLGGGCFWCTQAIFKEINGITKVVSGYSGGNCPGRPTYREICSGLTGHAEVVQVTFDPNSISYADLLIIFMSSHDPTTLNKQGGDKGTQYRSVIYYHNENQFKIAKQVLSTLNDFYEKPIVTEISPLKIFYQAEDYHQDYFEKNRDMPYCEVVIAPKILQLHKMHSNKLKELN